MRRVGDNPGIAGAGVRLGAYVSFDALDQSSAQVTLTDYGSTATGTL
jgi:hypothetical protein